MSNIIHKEGNQIWLPIDKDNHDDLSYYITVESSVGKLVLCEINVLELDIPAEMQGSSMKSIKYNHNIIEPIKNNFYNLTLKSKEERDKSISEIDSIEKVLINENGSTEISYYK